MAGVALLRTASAFVLLLLFGLLLRREWLTAAAVTAALAFLARLPLSTLPDDSILTWLGAAAVAGMFVFAATRFGWLATLVGTFVTGTLNVMPLTFTPPAWYADATVTTALVLVALAGYGFFVSLGGQRLFPDDV
jgi:hypothetical protein